ncbi:MAG: shikimate dehydrogenase [Candidatus Lokiarchaeota archaeon]|nr:shikimate dehydrogenase [Candidatus Lokiarchaeota archaeon]
MPGIEALSGKTKILCVIGDPIEHTMSPAMHNAAIRALGLDLVYVAFHVRPSMLEPAIDGFRALGITGINVTIPHKVVAMQYLEEIDPVAKAIGAINTIKNEGGKLIGRNTDADGAARALKASGVSIKGARVAMLGAGGAARAVGFALVKEGAAVTIVYRREDASMASDLARDIQRAFPSGSIATLVMDKAGIETACRDSTILVNATPVGMHPKPGETLVDPSLLHGGLSVFDVVYNPLETRLIKDARKAGCKVVPGIDMLVYQGALALEWWTGKDAPVDVMKRAALDKLGLK